jgi:uncharacterized protein (TIGR04255 family)
VTETFPKAPITEALLDIQVVSPEAADNAKLADFHRYIEERFPEKQEREVWTQEIKLKHGEAPKTEAAGGVSGYFFKSADKGKLVQVRKNGFTFHKLRPYENWETFRDEAKELWERYRQHVCPTNVSRLGLRYINRIEVPLPIKDFRDYCLLFPDIPPEIPQSLMELFLRFVVPDSESRSNGIVTVTFEPPTSEANVLGLILDIDVFQQFTVLSPDNDTLWKTFETLREYKNRIFMSSTTESAKKLFR